MGWITERKNKQGKTIYYAEVRRRGAGSAFKSFLRLTDARGWIQDTESNMRSGKYTLEAEAKQHTLNDAVQRFITEELPKKPRSAKDQERHLMWFVERIGSKTLLEVTPAALSELKGKFLQHRTAKNTLPRPQSWNRYMSSLSCVFEMCTRDWQWLEVNPARRIRREREAPGRVRYLSEDERVKLLEACKASPSLNLYPLVVLALSTGMRRGEIIKLTWQQLDLTKGIIILTETKNNQARRVPVRGHALELLRQHAKVRRIDSNYVFPADETKDGSMPPFNIYHFWYKALDAAGIPDFRFHDLRHSTASYLAMGGASLLEIAEVLGHKTLQMVKRYSHLAESHTAGVVERMNLRIFGS